MAPAAYALVISLPFDVSRTGPPIVDTDPDDDIFLLCALGAKASYVVTSDLHLLALESHQGIPIVSVEEFFTRPSLMNRAGKISEYPMST